MQKSENLFAVILVSLQNVPPADKDRQRYYFKDSTLLRVCTVIQRTDGHRHRVVSCR